MDLADKNHLSTQDSGGYFPTLEDAVRYEAGVKSSSYHDDRLRALKYLIDLVEHPVSSIIDFGVGDGGATEALGLEPTNIIGIDVSDSMIQLAEKNLANYSFQGKVGSVERLFDIPKNSIDMVLCLNVLGYLTREEQSKFFENTSRILKTGGHMVVMTGNELFDMFALNSGTAEFFERHFNQTNVENLLIEGKTARFRNADRRNPLNFGVEMEFYKLNEVRQSFASWHKQIPAFANVAFEGDLWGARLASRDHSFNSNALPRSETWKNFFCCSIFASLLKKQ
jgi:SAM-dependent methyltransferase